MLMVFSFVENSRHPSAGLFVSFKTLVALASYRCYASDVILAHSLCSCTPRARSRLAS